MIIAIIILSILLAATILYLASAIIHIRKIQEELTAISKEQHTQNMDIIEFMKYRHESTVMLLQHIEILKYLVEQDSMLGSKPIPYFGTVGEA
jgi:hypothetical protein